MVACVIARDNFMICVNLSNEKRIFSLSQMRKQTHTHKNIAKGRNVIDEKDEGDMTK